MNTRAYVAMAFGVAAAALAFWFTRRQRTTDLFVAPRPQWTTPPHGDPIAERRR